MEVGKNRVKPILIGKPPSIFTVIGENHLVYKENLPDTVANQNFSETIIQSGKDAMGNDIIPNPFNLESFIEFSRRSFVEENILFWLNVRMCKSAVKYGQISNEVEYRAAIDNIVNNFLIDGSQLQINVPKNILEETVLRIKTAKQFGVLDDGVFDVAAGHVLEIMISDIYPRFIEQAVTVSGLDESISTSWQIISSFIGFSESNKKSESIHKSPYNNMINTLFSYPHPINILEIKLQSLLYCITIAFAIFLDQFHVIFGNKDTNGFLMGPRIDPLSLFVTLLLAPIFSRIPSFFSRQYYRWTAGPPHRLADLVCFLLSGISLGLRLNGIYLRSGYAKMMMMTLTFQWGKYEIMLVTSNCVLFLVFLINFGAIWRSPGPLPYFLEKIISGIFPNSTFSQKSQQSFIQVYRRDIPPQIIDGREEVDLNLERA